MRKLFHAVDGRPIFDSHPPSSKVFSFSGKIGERALLKLRFHNDQQLQIVSLESVLEVRFDLSFDESVLSTDAANMFW